MGGSKESGGGMKATKTVTIKRAFALHPDQISRIAAIVREHGGDCASFKVECAGDLTLSPASIEELLAVPNIGDYKIKSLGIASWGGDSSTSIDVTFSTEGLLGPIRVYLSGDDADVIKTHERLMREILVAARHRWFHLFNADDPAGDIVLFFVCLALSGATAAVIYFGSGAFVPLPLRSFLSALIFLGGAIFGSSVVRGTVWWAYPRGMFLIGAGKQEYEEVRNRRQLVTISYWLVGLGMGVIAWFLTVFIGRWLHL
jgi:hypothetical protein